MFILRHHNTSIVTWFLRKIDILESSSSRSSSSISYNNFSLGEHWGTQHNSLLDNSYYQTYKFLASLTLIHERIFTHFFLIIENSALKNIHDDKPLSLQTA